MDVDNGFDDDAQGSCEDDGAHDDEHCVNEACAGDDDDDDGDNGGHGDCERL